MKQDIIVVEDFFPDLDAVLELAQGIGFQDDYELFGKRYTGFGAATLPIKHLIERAVNAPIQIKMSHVRLGRKDTPLTHYIHADGPAATHACVVYLTKPDCFTGTAFWRHKATGLDRQPLPCPPELFAELDKDTGSEEGWELTGLVAAQPNRAVIFDSSLFHCRYPKVLPIEGQQTPRLVNTVFFDING